MAIYEVFYERGEYDYRGDKRISSETSGEYEADSFEEAFEKCWNDYSEYYSEDWCVAISHAINLETEEYKSYDR